MEDKYKLVSDYYFNNYKRVNKDDIDKLTIASFMICNGLQIAINNTYQTTNKLMNIDTQTEDAIKNILEYIYGFLKAYGYCKDTKKSLELLDCIFSLCDLYVINFNKIMKYIDEK